MSQDCKIRMLFCEILLGYYSSFKFNYIICNCTNTNLQLPTHRLKEVISLSLRHFFHSVPCCLGCYHRLFSLFYYMLAECRL